MATKKTIRRNTLENADAKEWIANFNKAQFLQEDLYNTLESMKLRWLSDGAKQWLYAMEKSATGNCEYTEYSSFLEALEEFQSRLNDESNSELEYLIRELYYDKYQQED